MGIRLGREAAAAVFAVSFPSGTTAAGGLVLPEGSRRYVLLCRHEPPANLGIEHELGLKLAALRYRAVACGGDRICGSVVGEEEVKDDEGEEAGSVVVNEGHVVLVHSPRLHPSLSRVFLSSVAFLGRYGP